MIAEVAIIATCLAALAVIAALVPHHIAEVRREQEAVRRRADWIARHSWARGFDAGYLAGLREARNVR